MAELEHKTKMISIRLSEVELDFLKSRYQEYGARNVSDLARMALQGFMCNSSNRNHDLSHKLAGLEVRVTALESKLATLSEWGKVTS